MKRHYLFICLVGTIVAAGAQAQAGGPCPLVPTEGGQVLLLDPKVNTGTSRAVVVDDLPLAHTGQLLPLNDKGLVVGKDITAQLKQVFKNLNDALGVAGSSTDKIVKLNFYVVDDSHVPAIHEFIAQTYRGELRPTISLVVTELHRGDALVAADAVAISTNDKRDVEGQRNNVLVGQIGSHVSVLPRGGRIYISGQAADASDVKTATRNTLESLRATLQFLERSQRDIVQLKLFITPISAARDAYREIVTFCGENPVPTVVFVQWESKLPVEIELIAAAGPRRPATAQQVSHDGQGPDTIEYLTPPGVSASPVFSRVSRTFDPRTIYIGGLWGNHSDSPMEQVEEIFTNLTNVAERTGSDMRHLAKATYYVVDNATSQQLTELRPRYYDPTSPPAASKAVVRGVGQTGKTITLDMIAVPAR